VPLYFVHCVVLICLQHYIHGSSQGQFIVETYIVIFLRILLTVYIAAIVITMCTADAFFQFFCKTGQFYRSCMPVCLGCVVLKVNFGEIFGKWPE